MTLNQSLIIIGLSATVFAVLIISVQFALKYDTTQTNLSTDCPSYTVVNGQYVCND